MFYKYYTSIILPFKYITSVHKEIAKGILGIRPFLRNIFIHIINNYVMHDTLHVCLKFRSLKVFKSTSSFLDVYLCNKKYKHIFVPEICFGLRS